MDNKHNPYMKHFSFVPGQSDPDELWFRGEFPSLKMIPALLGAARKHSHQWDLEFKAPGKWYFAEKIG